MVESDGRSPEERLYRIVEDGLCIGCGLCQSVAGRERLRMVVTPEGEERPYAVAPRPRDR